MYQMKPCALVLSLLLGILSVLPAVWADDGRDIFTTARMGDIERVAELLDGDPELVNARTAAGETPLHYAAASQRLNVVTLLLERGADVNASDNNGTTPLHLTAPAWNTELITGLLAAGADVNVTDTQGDTPLHVAARRMNEQAMRLLLAEGAAVNARSKTGRTPMHVLGETDREPERFPERYERLVALLIENGGDPNLVDNNGVPAYSKPTDQPRPRDDYHTLSEMDALMDAWAANYPTICERHTIGTSVQGRALWAVRITDNLGLEEDEPEFKYISTMHGDEVVGMELCLNLIDYLLTNYGSDPQVTNLVDEVDIWIMPLMNPDGYVLGDRENYNGYDLNRSFPEWINGEPNTTAGRQPEVAAIMDWGFAESFTCSANFHGGALVVNYPFDNDGLGSVFSPTPDEDMFVWISEEYSQYNLPMWNGGFFHGITNGAEWYSIDGGMQDWNYRYMGNNEVTIELGNTKWPPYSQIPGYWDDNRESMLAYMETCLIGVRGLVTDAVTGDPLAATVTVVGRDHEIYTDPDVGDYHRMLLPGTYDLTFESDGYESLTVSGVSVSSGDATRQDVQLARTTVLFPNGGESLPVDTETTVTWAGNPAAQFHVQYTSNYGDADVLFDDFERSSLGADYATGGDADWYIATDDAHDGTRSARSGDISHSDVTWMTRTVGGGEISFWYRVSSEANYDYFNFYVDGERKLHVAGETGWVEYSTTLPAGSYELKFEYDKDGSQSHYSDCVWVDELTITVDNTVWSDVIALTPVGAMSTPWTPTETGSDYKVRVRAYYGGGSYGVWDESDATFEVVDNGLLGDLTCDGLVNGFDIDPFILVLGGELSAYYALYPDCDHMLADCNDDGNVDGFDIDPFLVLLGG